MEETVTAKKVSWRPSEPARELAYRKLYDRIANQDSCITFLLVELRAMQKRLDKLEVWRARSVIPDAPLNESISELGCCNER